MARRRRPHAEEHENLERWLVSYADFITLLFAFFVVMYSLSTINEGKYRVLSSSLVQAFRSAGVGIAGPQTTVPVQLPGQVAPPVKRPRPDKAQATTRRQQTARKMRDMADEIRRVLGPLAQDGRVSVTDGAFGVTVEINASVLFAPGEAVLGDEASTALRAVANVLSGTELPIMVEGHTDNTPISYRFPSNWELSAVRASSVVRLFIESGVSAARLTAAGYADQRPVAPNDTEANRARNRRVAITIESRLPAIEPESESETGDEAEAEGEAGTGRPPIVSDDPIGSILPSDSSP